MPVQFAIAVSPKFSRETIKREGGGEEQLLSGEKDLAGLSTLWSDLRVSSTYLRDGEHGTRAECSAASSSSSPPLLPLQGEIGDDK